MVAQIAIQTRIDAVTSLLAAAQETITTHLWDPKFPVTFTPVVLGEIFGDGRTLFMVTSVNDRPRYWLVRGCSTWTEEHRDDGPCFSDYADEISNAIASEFGLSTPDEEDEDQGSPGLYPMIDDRMGLSWCLADWPDLEGVAMTPHPLKRNVRLLA